MASVFQRIGHIAVVHQSNVLVWGGYQELGDSEGTGRQTEYHDPTKLVVYTPMLSRCVVMETNGEIPPQNSGACGLVDGDKFYVFGGYFGDPDYNCNTDTLFCLDLLSLTWKKIVTQGSEPLACDKLAGWSYRNKLYFFGGFGPPPSAPQRETPRFQLVQEQPGIVQWFHGRCWNNQLVAYDIDKNLWQLCKCQGVPPSPRAAHAAFRLGSKVYIFGGRLDSQRMNDLHMLDLETMTWSGNLVKPGSTVPCGRSWHSFTAISATAACLYGGFSSDNKPLGDLWIYHIPTNTWKENPNTLKDPRLWHQTVMVEGELIAVGGLQSNISNFRLAQVHAQDLLVINFAPKTLKRLSLDIVAQFVSEDASALDSIPHCLKSMILLKKQGTRGVIYC